MENHIILHQVLFLGILVLTGVIATRLGIIKESVKEGLSKIIMNVTLPLLIITTLARIDLNPAILYNSSLVLFFAFFALFSMFLWAYMFSKLLKLSGSMRAVFLNHHIFGNIVFLGFPLMDSLFPGGEGILYAAIYQLASNILMWTFGVWLFLKGNNTRQEQIWKNMLNPNTIALFLGMILMLIQLPVPDILYEPLSGLGRTTLFLSMLYIGSMLAYTSVKGMLKKYPVYIVSLNKLLIVPLLLSIILYIPGSILFPHFGMIAGKVLVMEASMPCMAIIVVIARQFNSDARFATENVFFSTILSIFSLPLIYAVLNWLGTHLAHG